MSAPGSSGRDYISHLPPELLGNIMAKLPISSYLDIAHTSSNMRAVIKKHAAMICNTAIRARHSLAVDFLKVEMNARWLVPLHKFIMKDERCYEEYLKEVVNIFSGPEQGYISAYSLKGRLMTGSDIIALKLSQPGPQLLYFLEKQGLFTICDKELVMSSKWRRTLAINATALATESSEATSGSTKLSHIGTGSCTDEICK